MAAFVSRVNPEWVRKKPSLQLKETPFMTVMDYAGGRDAKIRSVERQIPEPTSLNETELPFRLVGDLIMKCIYQYTIISAQKISDIIKLPYFGVIDSVLNNLRKAELIEVGGSEGLGDMAYQWVLTPKG